MIILKIKKFLEKRKVDNIYIFYYLLSISVLSKFRRFSKVDTIISKNYEIFHCNHLFNNKFKFCEL